MNTAHEQIAKRISRLSPIFDEEAFSRIDSSNDANFYARDRFVDHLDSLALSTVEKIIARLVVEKDPIILDLMAGWDSHIPASLGPAKVIGLGLNENELKANKMLSEQVLHDLNGDPHLPFPDNFFDTVLNTVSVDYMTQPIQVFQEVGRILKPGGLFLVIFSNRMFPQKAVKIWRESSEEERIILVEEFFRASGMFEETSFFVSKGNPRPKDDKYARMNLSTDPVYALYAIKKGAESSRLKRPRVKIESVECLKGEELEKRKKTTGKTLCCPHCGEKMLKWEVPENPFVFTWDNDFMYICFNDDCPYYIRGWDFMAREGNTGSYRLMFNPEKNTCQPVPVLNPKALREGIMEEEA